MKPESIQTIKQKLQTCQSMTDPYVLSLAHDQRAGVQAAIRTIEKKFHKVAVLKDKFTEMSTFENQLWQKGYDLVAGIDEVGRGPLAGPVVAAAVILPQDCLILGLNDSKQLSEAKRKELIIQIQAQALSISVGEISEQVIDEVNIYEATKLAMQQAVEQLDKKPDFLLIDAMHLANGYPQESLIKGDARSISIAAASVIAKEYRDELMKQYAVTYPGYGFEKNAGYGTSLHLQGLAKYGVTPIHRKTFAPVKNYK